MPSFPAHPDRRVTLVTGASAGIGEATARRLAALGHPVALGARRIDRCREIAQEINAAGGEAIGLYLDVTDGVAVKRFATEAAEQLGEPEVLVANAGSIDVTYAARTSTEQLRDEMDVNTWGAHRLLLEVVPAMVERSRGDIVFVSSDILHYRRPGMAGYLAAKFAMEGIAVSLQMELEGSGVRSSIVRPGPTSTEIGNDWDHDTVTTLFADMKRFGVARHYGVLTPDDVARAVEAVVSMPRGVHVPLLEVQPEAPIRKPR